MNSIDTDTQLCAVIGHPVGHSLSPAIHNAAFAAANLNFVYLAFDTTDPGALLGAMRAVPNFRGLSVTIPHKLAVQPHLDDISDLAKRIGSVNTITNDDGRLIGDSTDGAGTLRAFADAGVDLADKHVLFLGAGGAVRAVAFAIAEEGRAAGITVLARDPKKVSSLVRDLSATQGAEVAGGDLSTDIAAAVESHTLIIQGTPIGMAPEREGQSPIPAKALTRDHTVFDMVYKPLRTQLIRDAEAVGSAVILGREMLVNQAALQFEGWTGQPAPITAMRDAFDAATERVGS